MGVGSKVRLALGAAAAVKAYRTIWPTKVKTVQNKLCLVTGAASGVGRVLALELARRGAKLVLWDVQEAALEETRQLVLDEFPRANVQVAVCNLADRADIYRCAALLGDYGVDVVINNAGIVSGKYLTESDDDKMALTMNVNALAHMYVAKAFLPAMIRRDSGHIASIASMAAFVGAGGMCDYAASKFAARGFAEALSVELYERGISGVGVSCICPTHINTKLFKGFNGGPSLEPIDVAVGCIDAIEYNVGLVCLPKALKLTGIGFKALLEMDGVLGLKLPWFSPMASFDDSQANKVFEAMSTSKL